VRLQYAGTIAALFATILFGVELEKYTPAEHRHWSFQKRAHPDVPQFSDPSDKAWAKTPIDAFILSRLKKESLRPAPKASKSTLIRRAYFDLTGLPPTPQEIDAFVRDKSPDAWAKLVDKLLTSPEYGEKWGNHWLDVVRFGETDGFEYDTFRNDAWRYRDYVIQAFNSDKPYDQFIREQLAGDEIDPKNEITRTAAGFQRLGAVRKNAGNQAVASSRNETLTEMTNIVGSALLGVTLGCARCHNHKFDPFRHTDYYRIQAYFAGTFENDVSLATPGQQSAWNAKNEEHEKEMKALRDQMKELKGPALEKMQAKLAEMKDNPPPPLPAIFSVADDPSKATPIYTLARGDANNKGQQVGPRPLGILLPEDVPELPKDATKPRLQLANWVVDSENPLTARVIVNRIWEYHFGQGIVGTPNDFGRMGLRPTHPELLDFLANQFIETGWHFKSMHRMILMSSAYQQDSIGADEKTAEEKDGDDKLLWKFPRRRLEAEEIRDAALQVAGKLNLKMGGPSVIVPIDQELVNLLYKPSQWTVTPDETDHYRRSIYLLHKRNLRLPFMEVFDGPDFQISCPRREMSTHPPQALELLNGDFSNQMADALADRLVKEAGKDHAKQVDLAYRLAAGRAPSLKEKQLAVAFLQKQPLREFALAVFNLNAFLYVN
jgi:Protein of unknown function (DUF1553)/Protein of unknown function (DUF1549)